MHRAHRIIAGGMLALLTITPAAAAAQSQSSRPTRLIVPFAAGGPADAVARTVASALSKLRSQAFVVENRLGADGAVAVQAMVTASADGHTLLFGSASLVPLTLLKNPPPFDFRHLAPVSKVSPAAWAMYVPSSLPATSLAAFVAYAHANSGRLNYAASTLNDVMAATQFVRATGAQMQKVPYKGAAQVMPDLIAGRVHANFSPLSAAALQHVQSGQIRMLAIVSPQRSPLVPDVPTMHEAGVAGIAVPGWTALFAPAQTPRDVVHRLSREAARVLQDPDVRAQLAKQAATPEPSTPEALAALIETDLRTWRDFIAENRAALE